ncbi:MAG: SipW-dependent-type signal peptide-containing protein [Pseudoflavonifractor sp.]|nr:SipW-dependent-type signal peptide-containing protein [Pseudoflavonifractor sp.]
MKKKSILIAGLSVMIIASMAIAGTLAYFTNTQTATNTFTVGNVAITLNEAPVSKTGDTWTADPTAARVTENAYSNVYPGAVLPKDPTVTVNTGSSDAYVRVKATVSHAAAWKAACAAHGITDLTTIFGGYVDANWSRAAITEDTQMDTITYIYNYVGGANAGRLAADGTTGALFTSVTIPAGFTSAELSAIGANNGFTMNIVSDAIQAEGFANVTAAFTAFDA